MMAQSAHERAQKKFRKSKNLGMRSGEGEFGEIFVDC